MAVPADTAIGHVWYCWCGWDTGGGGATFPADTAGAAET